MSEKNNMQRWGCIYRFTCTLNNKKYIGQSCDFKNRKKTHKNKKSSTPISQAIQKHGLDAFKQEIVVDGIPEEDLDDLEDYYIDVEDTLVPNGYNVRKKGGNVSFNKHSQKWEAYGPKHKFIGYYFTKEKANEALKLYKSTGERMESDVRRRRKGTGSIRKRGKRYEASIKINKKNYSKMFDTEEQCEEWLRLIRDS